MPPCAPRVCAYGYVPANLAQLSGENRLTGVPIKRSRLYRVYQKCCRII